MNIALHFAICTLLLCGIVIWAQRGTNKKPRTYLAIFYVLSASMILIRLLLIYKQGISVSRYPILPASNLYGGLLIILFFFLYPIEVVSPGWFSPRRMLLLFLPLVIITLVLFIIPFDFRELSSIMQVWEHIAEPNVWFRVLMLFACIIPYSLTLLFIPYNWKRSRVDCRWIRTYTLGAQGISLLFILFMLTGSFLVSAVHITYYTVLLAWIAYQELYLRLTPAVVSVRADTADAVPSPEKSVLLSRQVANNPLWERLTLQMDEKELWRTPDLTLENLSKNLYTNRTTLSALIQQQGYSGYTEFINRRRIEAFIEAVNGSKSINMQQLFYEAGFRSKSTALRNFRLYMGCTPGEYIQRTTERKKETGNSVPDSSKK